MVKQGDEGLYSLIFARCKPAGIDAASVNFKLNAAFWNPGPNYLSACEKQVPVVFLLFFLCFASAGGMWAWLLWKRSDHVHSIHKLMLVLVAFKSLALLFDSVRYHYIALTGSAEAWSIVYYIITFFKSLLLFTVILLIGTGWSLVKPYIKDPQRSATGFSGFSVVGRKSAKNRPQKRVPAFDAFGCMVFHLCADHLNRVYSNAEDCDQQMEKRDPKPKTGSEKQKARIQ